jgi:uncharacterized protein YlxW (UPF0749 family)
MNGGEFMVVMIVAVVMIASIFKSRAKFHYHVEGDQKARVENQQLREEVQQLKERIKVLERITVEKENSLAKEIESLRDR